MSDSTKSSVITSALPYANGEIHIGHIASTYLPADIFTRFSRVSGKKAYHICATDDFGTPILIKAEKEKMSPAEYVELWNKRDYEDFSSLAYHLTFSTRQAPRKMSSSSSTSSKNCAKTGISTTR